MRSKRIWLVLLVAVVLTLPAIAGEPGPDTNVLITFSVGSSEDGRDAVLKTYEMVVNANGHHVEMSTGARVPIPTTSFKVSDDGTRVAAPVTSYTYQQIGFSAKINAKFNEDGSIQVRGRVEDSSLTGNPAADGRPFIQSMQQNISATLTNGKPLRISRVDEYTRSFFIEIKAERLDETGERVAVK